MKKTMLSIAAVLFVLLLVGQVSATVYPATFSEDPVWTQQSNGKWTFACTIQTEGQLDQVEFFTGDKIGSDVFRSKDNQVTKIAGGYRYNVTDVPKYHAEYNFRQSGVQNWANAKMLVQSLKSNDVTALGAETKGEVTRHCLVRKEAGQIMDADGIVKVE